ncbi:stalk domain-containing protein [Paenibacillus dakarensis]|uniref:stalk domain-containing protein n=1 Tax=Paenibacillus dakarensis TaxID=1527293 RepID=UPI0006D534CD|nr:stalk domain-containing protein [Paenibacillus dakarensis]
MKKKAAIALTSLAMLGCLGTGVYAGSNLQEIKAYLNPSIKFKVDGQPVQLKNSSGAVITPISYNNTTYLPVRAISDVLGVTVNFDGKTNTIQLGEQTEGVSIAAGFDSLYHTKDPKMTIYNGKDYKDVFFDNGSGTRGSSFMLYPKGKYQKLYLQVAAIGSDIEDFYIQDSDTDTVLKKQNILVEDGLVTVEVNIAGVQSLFVHGNVKKGGSVFIPLTTSYYK